MSMFTVHRTLMHHELGTKFYQAFYISDDDRNKAACLTHWGKISIIGDREKKPRPVMGGETQHHVGGSKYGSVIREKEKRGYSKFAEFSERFKSRDAFEKWLVEQMGASSAHAIMVNLGLGGVGGDPIPEPAAESVPSTRDDTETLADTTTERPESWGSW
jgi:hypothetical protein